jgi:undecaprenyl phosphate N,N'-diacetylbacillosamine 1-phosphate transferase
VYKHIFKQLFDFVLALVLTIFFLPVFLIIGLLVYFKIGKPIFFCQKRPGKNEALFTVYKFRSMTDKKDEFGNLLPDEMRITKYGAFLRKTSLDELPQLFNVLKGDISFVGPRPLLIEYLPLYNEIQKNRHNVKPGITGWAQINGRNTITWRSKFEYDIWYIEHITFQLDLKILFLTVVKIIKAEGISSENSATMEKFVGNN